MNKKRIIVVEDEVAVRQALSKWFSHEYEIVNFQTAESFLQVLKAFNFKDGKPTVMLLDFQMSGMTGVELQNVLQEMNIEFPIIFMSGNAGKEDIIDAWRGGAVDFILKPFSGPKISEAINKLFEKIESSSHRQQPVISSMAVTDIPLTQREAEVLLLLGKGCRQNEVAEILGISLRSVKMYRSYIKDKLRLNTLVELSRFCDHNQDLIQKLADNK